MVSTHMRSAALNEVLVNVPGLVSTSAFRTSYGRVISFRAPTCVCFWSEPCTHEAPDSGLEICARPTSGVYTKQKYLDKVIYNSEGHFLTPRGPRRRFSAAERHVAAVVHGSCERLHGVVKCEVLRGVALEAPLCKALPVRRSKAQRMLDRRATSSLALLVGQCRLRVHGRARSCYDGGVPHASEERRAIQLPVVRSRPSGALLLYRRLPGVDFCGPTSKLNEVPKGSRSAFGAIARGRRATRGTPRCGGATRNALCASRHGRAHVAAEHAHGAQRGSDD